MAERTVKCPLCGQAVAVPTTGEKARCPGCGQKFRFECPPVPPDLPKTKLEERELAKEPVPVAPPPLPGARQVRCPQCGRMVQVPTTGEKVQCPGCGRKFRFEAPPPPEDVPETKLEGREPPEAPAAMPAAAPEPSQPEAAGPGEADEVKCPRCGGMVRVPTTGEKVHCPGCGQKFRYEGPAASARPDEAAPPPVEGEPSPAPGAEAPEPMPVTGRAEEEEAAMQGAPPRPAAAPVALPGPSQPEAAVLHGTVEPEAAPPGEADEIKCPRCGSMVRVPMTGEKVHCPGCGQKFRFEAPAAAKGPEAAAPGEAPPGGEPAAPEPSLQREPTPLEADEFRALWPAACQLVRRVYEEGRATDADRLLFRAEADRAAALAALCLGAPGPLSTPGHVFITTVLSQMTLDEILALSLEDFRHLHETLDEAQRLLDERLPKPPVPKIPVVKPAARPLVGVAQLAQPARRRRAPSLLQTIVGVTSLLVVAAVVLGFTALRDTVDRLFPPREPAITRPTGPGATTAEVVNPAPKRPRTNGSARPATVPVPTFVKPEPPKPATSTAVAPQRPTEGPQTPAEAPKRVFSRWKPDAEGWIALFDGKGLDGLNADPAAWSVKEGILYGLAPQSSTTATAQEAAWRDYCLAVEAMLGKTGVLTLGHGGLTARLSDDAARLGTAQRVLDERSKGLTRKQWYRIEFDVRGDRAEVRVDGQPLLVTSGHSPEAGAPTLEAQQGGVAFKSIRVRLHESDPDYRAVALGEGRLVAASVPAPGPRTVSPETPTPSAKLGPGNHRLFNGSDLSGWTQSGAWAVRDGSVVGRAPAGPVATAAAGSPDWQDYVLEARCRIVRADRMTRDGEYYLLIFRYRDAESFCCVRFPIEGIYEVGYYRNGTFREAGRARHGLGSRFNQWHDVEITVRGDQVWVVIDNVRTGAPPWSIKGMDHGQVGLGVTGGEAAFQNVRVSVAR